jgi:isopentenyl-diphosphate Delta-isomerase
MSQILILVDENDVQLGTGEKMAVHRQGLLHRCFSIFVFNEKGDVLMQKRASSKYHSGGLWTNTCCGHPVDGEATKTAAARRLREEMGFSCEVEELFSFIYRAELDHDLIEHEFDHVFTGAYDGPVSPDAAEAEDYAWRPVEAVNEEMARYPERFTVWSRIALKELLLRKELMSRQDAETYFN